MSNENMFLYWGSGSGPCVRVIAVLAEKGLWDGCPNKLIEFSKKEHKTDEVLKLNPRGQVPTFKDGDVVINESVAICLYLENIYSNDSNKLIPLNITERGQFYQRFFELKNLDTWVADPIVRYKMRTPKDQWDASSFQEKYKSAEAEIKRWDAYLTGKKFLVGTTFTMADLFLLVELARFQRFGLRLDKYPALKEYFEFHKDRSSLKASTPPHWKDSTGPGFLSDMN